MSIALRNILMSVWKSSAKISKRQRDQRHHHRGSAQIGRLLGNHLEGKTCKAVIRSLRLLPNKHETIEGHENRAGTVTLNRQQQGPGLRHPRRARRQKSPKPWVASPPKHRIPLCESSGLRVAQEKVLTPCARVSTPCREDIDLGS